ncbi:MAG: polysulfide reductase, partial [Asgard group archaeon]|nr:polysulfide reductase [Asgard group archaeon]
MATVSTNPSLLSGRAVVEKSMLEFGKKTMVIQLVLLLIMFKGIYEYSRQYKGGLGVTALGHKVFWGMYITNFVFFIGVSHAGTLISAILRVTGAEWRTPVTRLAEEITALALIFGAASVLIDLGRIDRVWNMIIYGNIDSPLMWDLISISFYLVGSLIFLYLPLIPDFAYYRDNLPLNKYKVRRTLYRLLALGWQNTEEQHKILEKNITRMSYIIIPIAVSVHTVVSWIMSMTWRVGWNSTIFGPYFVIGAIFSGLASLLIAMVLFSWAYKLQEFLTKQHFVNLSKLLLTFTIFYLYFSLSEYLTVGYKSEIHEIELLHQLFYGEYAALFWYFILGGLIIPMILLTIVIVKHKVLSYRIVLILVLIASIMINIGMWIKRYLITVPTLARPTLQEDWTF